MSDSISCKVCNIRSISKIGFLSHMFGKKHKKKASAKGRGCSEAAIRDCAIEVVADQYIGKVVEQILFKHLDFDVIDAHWAGLKCFIEFNTREDAFNALKAKIKVEGLKLRAYIVNKERQATVSDAHRRKAGRDARGKVPQLSSELSRQLNSLNHNLDPDALILQLVKEIELKPSDMKIREEIRVLVENFLNPLFPRSRAYIFGSSVNNLGFTGCDVDMVADLGYDCWAHGRGKEVAEKEAEKMTKYLANEIRKRRLGYNVIPIGRARVPIVKFTALGYGLEVDLSFKNGMPHHNTELIHLYSTAHDIVKPFMMFLRYWAKLQGISGGGHPTILITNYCLSMMMLFWLMIRKIPIVPPVGLLQQGLCPIVIDGCNCSFRRHVTEWREKYHSNTIVDLAIEFFEFYGKMDCKEWVICPLAGALIPRQDIKHGQPSFPQPFLSQFYKKKCTLQLNTPLCVQDPFDICHNIARGFREGALNMFQLKCLKAFDICKNIRDGTAPIASLFEEYQLEDVRVMNAESEPNVSEVTIVDEVVSLSSNDSVELLQELESLERSGGLKELLENADMDEGESIDKRSESGSQDSSDAVVLCETIGPNSPSVDTNKSTAAREEEIIFVGEVSTETKAAAVDVVTLEDSFDQHSDIMVSGNGFETQEGEGVLESLKSAPQGPPPDAKMNVANGEVFESSNSEPCKPCSTSNPTPDNEICVRETVVLNPANEPNNSIFDYYSKNLFKVSADGSFDPLQSAPDSHFMTKEKCIADLFAFILKRVLLCEILDDHSSVEEFTQVSKEERKRKSADHFPSSNKFLKVSSGEVVSTKSEYVLVSTFKCRTRYKIWEGRKKLPKDLKGGSALNPLQSELILSEKFENSEENFRLDFETRLWKNASNPARFCITARQPTEPSESMFLKLENMYSHFFIFFPKFIKNLMLRIDGFNFKS